MLKTRVVLDDTIEIFLTAVFGERCHAPIWTLFLFTLVLVLFGPLALFWLVVLRLRPISGLAWKGVQIFSLVLMGCFIFLASSLFTQLVNQDVVGVLGYWFVAASFAPGLSLLFAKWDEVKPRLEDSPEARLRQQEDDKAWQADRGRGKAGRKARFPPPNTWNVLSVGVYASGETFPSDSLIEVSRSGGTNRWVRMDDAILDQHCFVLGTTGAGKTETLLRIMEQVLRNTNRRLYFIDGKGDLTTAAQVASMVWEHRDESQTPIFKLGHMEDGNIYDGFQGSARDVYNRLAIMAGVLEAEGNALHFADRKKRIIQMVTGMEYWNVRNNLGVVPPRDFVELVERIDEDWLKETYRDTPLESQIKLMGGKNGDIVNLNLQFSNLMSSFGFTVNRYGFSLEGTRTAVFSLRTQSAGIDAQRFLDFFNEDMKDFIGKRQPKGESGLIIIDEFGAFGNRNIVNILSLARSSGMGVILATQTLASLANEQVAQTILDNCNTYFVMKSQDSEALSARAGTKMAPEIGHQIEEGQATGVGTVRYQHQFKVSPNDVGQLKPGECFIVRDKRVLRLQIAKVDDITLRKEAIAKNPDVIALGSEALSKGQDSLNVNLDASDQQSGLIDPV